MNLARMMKIYQSVLSTLKVRMMAGVDERPSSSLSMSSTKGSKIPRLCRSASFRERNVSSRITGSDCESINKRSEFNSPAKQTQNYQPNIGGLCRSYSFATSRGIKELSLNRQEEPPPAPELKRRKLPVFGSAYVSPYNRKVIAAERRSQPQTSPSTSRDRAMQAYYSPQISRRPSMPPLMSSAYNFTPKTNILSIPSSDEVTPERDEDNTSEMSFGSVSSAHSCDDGVAFRKVGGSLGMGRRPRNILHCSHAHTHDPDDYLTPTQRAARKIRELHHQLKVSRREISERDSKISALTRDLVLLRMNKAENEQNAAESRTIQENPIKTGDSKRAESKYSWNSHRSDESSSQDTRSLEAVMSTNERSLPPQHSLFLPCLTPTSDISDHDLRFLEEEKRINETDALTPKEEVGPLSLCHSPAGASVGGDSDSGDLSRSLADSGNYEDLPSPCLSLREALDAGFPSIRKIMNSFCAADGISRESSLWAAAGAAEEAIKGEWKRRLEKLKRNHMEEYQEMKERHNDKVEMLLSKLSDANLKYFELRPQHDRLQERSKELDSEVERLKDDLRESEIRHQKVYLQMYIKGQQAARFEADERVSVDSKSLPRSRSESGDHPESEEKVDAFKNKVVFGLLKQLAQAEDEMQKLKVAHSSKSKTTNRSRNPSVDASNEIDPEITLQFLKSAIYYFLTDRENSPGHLRAIESILGYSSVEREKITKLYRN